MRCLSSRTALVLLASLASCLSFARADYHYASHSGSNEYPYTSWQTAADSIQKAINAGSPHDTVYVGSGIWTDAPCTLWADLSLIGAGMDSTVLRSRPMVFYITPYKRTHIEGLMIDGSSIQTRSVGIYPVYHDTDVVITGNKFQSLGMGVIGTFTGRIENNVFVGNENAIDGSFDACSLLVKNNTFTGQVVQFGECIRAINGRWTVVNNLFKYFYAPDGNQMVLLNMFLPTDSAYMANNLLYRNAVDENYHRLSQVEVVDWSWLENNTIIGFDNFNQHRAVAAGLWQDTLIDLRNNVISGFDIAVTNYDEGVRSFYNAIWNCRQVWVGAPFDTVIGNVFADPMFVDSTDFHLQMYSPLIDAGDPNILDVDGSRSDIGCYGGLGGESYPYVDLPPRTPDSLSYRVSGDSLIVVWRMNTEADFNRYVVNRDTVAGFTPWAGNIMAEPETSLFLDLNWDRSHNYYYRIAAYDRQWNLSAYSDELAVNLNGIRGFDDPNVSRFTRIEVNYPNPFNDRTMISYYLADIGYQPAEVRLYIYDLLGNLVRRLVDSRLMPGRYQVIWDGLGEGGEELSSGVYFVRLTVSGVELQRAQKITLMK